MSGRTEYEIGCELLAAQYPDRKGELILLFPPEASERFVLKSWLKFVGETVRLGDEIAVFESETRVYYIESYLAGVLTEHVSKCGDVVQLGDTIVKIRNEN